MLGELPGCAWRALRLYLLACFGRDDVTPEAIGFVQTAGELLGWHPHLHVLLADGGWLPDGSFRHLLYLDSDQVEKLFRAEVLRLLVERHKIGEEVVESLLSWRHSGFSVDAAVRVEQRQEAARLGRYGIRCPLVLSASAGVARTRIPGLGSIRARPRRGPGGLIAPTGPPHLPREKSDFLLRFADDLVRG